MTKSEAWRQWWYQKHGKNQPMGSYHPMEGYIFEAWSDGWDAGLNQSCPPCNGNCNQGRECPARDAAHGREKPVQVSPLEFVTAVLEKEHLVGKPIMWAQWPNEEKNT